MTRHDRLWHDEPGGLEDKVMMMEAQLAEIEEQLKGRAAPTQPIGEGRQREPSSLLATYQPDAQPNADATWEMTLPGVNGARSRTMTIKARPPGGASVVGPTWDLSLPASETAPARKLRLTRVA